MTLDALRAYGANTGEGLSRCMNNEPFYLRMVAMALADDNFDALASAVNAGDAIAAFAAAVCVAVLLLRRRARKK